MPDRHDIYTTVTNRIVAELEAGTVPWVQPWSSGAATTSVALPHNPNTGRTYSGINILMLWSAAAQNEYPANSWLTYRQAAEVGGHVRKGEHGTTVVYANRFVPEAERQRAQSTGKDPRAVPFLRAYTVFNVCQCDGLPADLAASPGGSRPAEILPHVEALIRATGANFRIHGDRAYYTPATDIVTVPPPQAYFQPINWHRTALHELVHNAAIRIMPRAVEKARLAA